MAEFHNPVYRTTATVSYLKNDAVSYLKNDEVIPYFLCANQFHKINKYLCYYSPTPNVGGMYLNCGVVATVVCLTFEMANLAISSFFPKVFAYFCLS